MTRHAKGQDTSRELYARARNVMPGGVTRATITFRKHPRYIHSANGAWLEDVDGNRLLDFTNNFTTLIHGHANQRITNAVCAQIVRGTCFANPTEAEIDLAEILCQRVPSIQRVRFVASGTEAVMFAIKAARASSGHTKIAKFEGAYHGGYDWAEVSESVVPTHGDGEIGAQANYWNTPKSVLDDVVVLPFNDVARSEQILRKRGHDLAAVLVDVMPSRPGLIPLTPEYVSFLNDFRERTGTAIISDEVLNFRASYRGAAYAFGLEADYVTLGKIVGGGFPVGAIGGSVDAMQVFDHMTARILPQGGTFAANPVTMIAGSESMRALTVDEFDRLSRLGDRARHGIRALAQKTGRPISATGRGSLFRLHPKKSAPGSYLEAFQTDEEGGHLRAILHALEENGILLSSTGLGAISTPMEEADIDFFLNGLEESLLERAHA